MRFDEMYAVEVAPSNVKYYAFSYEETPEEKGMVKLPLAWLIELMKAASETGEITKSASIYDVDIKGKTDEEFDKALDEVQDTIDCILRKTRG